MLEDFLSYIESNLSVIREDKILLSISGGVDSMVMLHLFSQLEYNIEVAHINHSTRNGESERDMSFVKTYCEQNSIPFHTKTLNYAELNKGNFQENARRERFHFLSKVKASQQCKWVATAHHKDDRWETFLMHLNRKSGIQGLTSLRSKEKDVIHPLLLFTKDQIVDFASKHKIEFVHDKSNDSDDYTRNAIRHKITPEIINIFPDFIQNVNHSISNLEHTSTLLKELILKNEFVTKHTNSGDFTILLEKVKPFKNNKVLLYHLIEEFGYNYSTACDILETNTTGAQFFSNQYESIIDRGNLIIRKRIPLIKTNFSINAAGKYQLPNGKNLLVEVNGSNNSAQHLWIDINKVQWPLTIRNIQPGDKFKPQGMKGATKTIKKLCTDLKINRFTKEELLVVCQGEMIIQLIDFRSANDYTTNDIKSALTFSIVD